MPAFCTASIDSVRIVSIESCSMSEFVMEYLVEPLLPLPGRTICLCPLLAGMEHVPERRIGRFVDDRDGCAAQRRLLDAGENDGARERVGHDLYPLGRLVERAAGRDHFLDFREQVGDC